jgi:hypothetical protein
MLKHATGSCPGEVWVCSEGSVRQGQTRHGGARARRGWADAGLILLPAGADVVLFKLHNLVVAAIPIASRER